MTKAVIFNTIATKLVASHMAGLCLRVFDPGKAGWKMTEDGKSIEMKDGNPVWIDANGGEGVLAGDTIARLNGEAAKLRQRAETAEAALVPFKDIDATEAKKAIELTKKIDQKKLIDAGDVDKVKQEIEAGFRAQINELTDTNQKLTTNYNDLRVDSVFAQSDFIRDSVAMPRDFFEAAFRKNFKVDKDGKLEITDKSGNRVMSVARRGEYAEPEEALQILVDQHPQKATILKASQNSGGGNNGGGGNRGGGRTVRRADYDQMAPQEQARIAADMGKGVVTIVD